MKIRESDYFAEDGRLVPGFKVMGGFKGRRAHEYTPAERTIIRHFFTNDDSNVYCATENMSSQLWALLMGQYARSPDSAKDRLLTLFRDVHEKAEEGTTLSLEEVAGTIERGRNLSEVLTAHFYVAGDFVDRFGVKYGHASLRDSGVVGLCFEGVSQRATKHLESAREGAYQEQSTRALPFTPINMGMPLEVRETPFESRFMAFAEKASALYGDILRTAKTHLSEKYAYLRAEANSEMVRATGIADAKLSKRAWENGIVGAKAFDIARYLLPQQMTTSLGMTLNARRLQDQLTEWQSSEFVELRILGRAAQIESMEIMPSLMKHGGPSEFHGDLARRRRSLNDEFVPSGDVAYRNLPVSSRLIKHTQDIENAVLASILFNGSDSTHSFEELEVIVRGLSLEDRRKIAASQFEGKEPHELNPKTMEVGSFTFERTYDIGAYRDLQRQRGDRQQIAPYSTFAYNMPKEIPDLGGDLEERFHEVAREVKQLHDDLIDAGLHSAAEYVPLMANMIRHVTTKDPVQCFYEAKLRAQAAGADSYRKIARQEIHQVLNVMPSFKGLVEFDDAEYPLNRLPETLRMEIDRVIKRKRK
ncbi:MAG: FAD-dependent thymidylate synthase [Nanoarchaeota archaeon]|nr:FAD-dependent thymidylate synthase [Nanoarchaeota archaeon]